PQPLDHHLQTPLRQRPVHDGSPQGIPFGSGERPRSDALALRTQRPPPTRRALSRRRLSLSAGRESFGDRRTVSHDHARRRRSLLESLAHVGRGPLLWRPLLERETMSALRRLIVELWTAWQE